MAKTKNTFPSDQELKVMRKKLSRGAASYVLPPDASAVEKAKYDVCRQILVYMHTKGLNQRELAAKASIPETRVSEVVHYHIWKFTLDRLMGYLEKLNPRVTFKVA
jgi:predicted XRE-type DNA-binding protein